MSTAAAAKPKILFFARGYQAEFFPKLLSDRYEAVFVTLTPAESLTVERQGQTVDACFEQAYPSIGPARVEPDYPLTSFVSERFLGRFGPEKRLEILAKEIAFWAELLDRHRPVAVVNELVAIEISEVLLIECRKRGIIYLAGMNCVVENLFYWLPDPISLSGSKLPRPVPGPEAVAAARAYMAEIQAKDYRPFYVRDLAGRRAIRPFLAAIVHFGLWKLRAWIERHSGRFIYESYGEEFGKRISVYLKSLYRRYDTLEALPKDAEVVFYPLHQEPEATLNYMSEFYSNQVATIENILKCLSTRQVLVVKEHPVDKGALLQRKFWNLRKNNSSVFFLPAEVHGREVLRFARRVVTLTSTVGWEAAVMGERVYVLGEIFYDAEPGVQRIANFAELKRALRTDPSESERLTLERAEAFVASMAEMSYPGNPFADLEDPVNIRQVVDAIEIGAGIGGSAIAPHLADAAPVND